MSKPLRFEMPTNWMEAKLMLGDLDLFKEFPVTGVRFSMGCNKAVMTLDIEHFDFVANLDADQIAFKIRKAFEDAGESIPVVEIEP